MIPTYKCYFFILFHMILVFSLVGIEQNFIFYLFGGFLHIFYCLKYLEHFFPLRPQGNLEPVIRIMLESLKENRV